MKVVIALDLSTISTGLALFEDGLLIDYCTIKASNIEDMYKKITDMINYYDVNDEYDITLVCEDVYCSINKLTYKTLSVLQGMIKAYALENGYKFDTITASQWRSALGLNSKAAKRAELKQATIDYVNDGLIDCKVESDEADAICVGLGYCELK